MVGKLVIKYFFVKARIGSDASCVLLFLHFSYLCIFHGKELDFKRSFRIFTERDFILIRDLDDNLMFNTNIKEN